MLPGEHAVDHLLLDAAEMVEAEDAFEEPVRVGHVTLQVGGPSAAGFVPA